MTKAAMAKAAETDALLSFLGLVFALIGLIVRRGFAPGWRIRCPVCGLTVDASTCMVRLGAIGTDRGWGWCERCHRHRWLVIETMAPPQDAVDGA